MPAKPINWARFAGTQTQPALAFTYFKERLVQTHKHNTCCYVNWPGLVAIIATAQLFGTSLWFSANGAAEGLASGIIFRFMVGVSLAGIYPLGLAGFAWASRPKPTYHQTRKPSD